MIKYAYTGLFGAIFLLTALAPEPVWAACIQSGTDVRCAGTPGGFVAGTGVNGLTVVVDPGAVTTDNGTQSIGLNNNNTVTNNGTISASTLGALGLQVGTNNFITNNGTISTTGAASTALAAGSATTITNEGKITSIGDFGVTVALGSNNTLTNNGEIDVEFGTGLNLFGFGGSVQLIHNTGGTFTGGGSLGLGDAARLTLNKNVTLAGDTVELYVGLFGGSATVDGTGVLTVENTLHAQKGLITNDIEVNDGGTIYVDTDGELTITGDVNVLDGGVIKTEANDSDAELNVTGAITLSYGGELILTSLTDNAVTLDLSGGGSLHQFDSPDTIIIAAGAGGAEYWRRPTCQRGPMPYLTHIGPIAALIAGVLILIMPRLLNYIVALYLIIDGATRLLR